jgi:hypothetical protein
MGLFFNKKEEAKSSKQLEEIKQQLNPEEKTKKETEEANLFQEEQKLFTQINGNHL